MIHQNVRVVLEGAAVVLVDGGEDTKVHPCHIQWYLLGLHGLIIIN